MRWHRVVSLVGALSLGVALASSASAQPPGRGPHGQGPQGKGPHGQGPQGQGPHGQGPHGMGPHGMGPHGHDGFDGHGPWGRLEDMEQRAEWMANKLGVDERRRGQIRQLVRDAVTRAQTLQTQMRETRERMHTLMQADQSTEAEVVATARRLGELRTEMHVLRVRTMFQVRQVLTPDERARLKTMRETHLAQVRQSCSADLSAKCPQAQKPHEQFRCLMDNRAQLSQACQQALPPQGMGPGGPGGPRGKRGGHRR